MDALKRIACISLLSCACAGQSGAGATVTTLGPGDSHCPTGGIQVQVGSGAPRYVCNGAAGAAGMAGSSGANGSNGTCTSALAYGADPTGASDSSGAINMALAATGSTAGSVCLPCGTFHVTHAIMLGSRSGTTSPALAGQDGCTIIDVSTDFDPTADGVVIVDGPTHETTIIKPSLQDLHFVFHQPLDIVTTAAAAAAAGTTTLTVAGATGVVAGDYVVDVTHYAAIVQWNTTTPTMGLTKVTAVNGNTVTLTNPVQAPGIANGDSIAFAQPRSAFHTLATGCATQAGSPGCMYPWVVYGSGMGEAHFDNLLVEGAWNGLYLHGGSVGGAYAFDVGDVQVGALNVGLDIDDIHNFPTIASFMGYAFGFSQAGPAFGENYYDGKVVCANLGATDGITINSLQCWTGGVNLLASWSWGTINSLMLDGTSSFLTDASTSSTIRTKIGEMYISGGQTPSTYNAIAMTSGALEIGDLTVIHAGNGVAIDVTGGLLAIQGGNLWGGGAGGNSNFATVSGGQLDLYNTSFSTGAPPSNFVAIRQSMTGVLKMVGGSFGTPGGVVGVAIDADNAGNLVQGVDFANWTFSALAPVSTAPLGVYTPDGAVSTRQITSGTTDQERLSDLVIAWESTSGGAKAQSIYGCSANNAGQSLTIIDGHGDAGTNNITVTPQTGTVDGAASKVINANHGALHVICDGVSNWLEGS